MGRTREELLNSISGKELAEWEAFYGIEPFGPAPENLNFGQIASILYNVNRGKGKRAIPPKEMALGDFREYKKPRKQPWQEILTGLKEAFKSAGTKVVEKKREKGD